MADIFFLYFIIGGLALLVEHFGGIQYLMNLIAKHIRSGASALLGMGFLVTVADVCVANNTVAILIVSKISKRISEQFNVPLRNAASVLDIFLVMPKASFLTGRRLLGFISSPIQWIILN